MGSMPSTEPDTGLGLTTLGSRSEPKPRVRHLTAEPGAPREILSWFPHKKLHTPEHTFLPSPLLLGPLRRVYVSGSTGLKRPQFVYRGQPHRSQGRGRARSQVQGGNEEAGLSWDAQSTHSRARGRVPEQGGTTMGKSFGSGSAQDSSPDPVAHRHVSFVELLSSYDSQCLHLYFF